MKTRWSLKRIVSVTILLSVFLQTTCRAEVIDRVIAVVNDAIITLSELNAAAAAALDKLPASEKKDAEKTAGLRVAMLDSLVEQKLVKQAADKAGIEISEREIDNAVDDVMKRNNLTKDTLLLALANSGLTHREYREQLKEQIRQVKFINKEFRSKISPRPEDIEDYYRQNQDEFKAGQSYRVEIILIPDSVDDKTTAATIKAVQDGIADGEAFEALSRRYSGGAGAGEELVIASGEVGKAMIDALSRLEIGKPSKAVRLAQGVYFFKLKERIQGRIRPIEEAREEIHERLFKKAMDERFTFWLIEAKKKAHIEVRL
ncbi:MAG: SurA N-terminal domain-containing protein [Deltaproteobacteria bacterium]|nr:SurA N-terminal domain-containing protein [Deltaproteobacteria bacterium]